MIAPNRAIAVALALALGLAPLAWAGEKHPHAAHGASGQIHKVMMDAMHEAMDMKMSGDTDRDFAAMMIDHHRQAVEMAKIEVAHGKNPELKAMAQKMIDAQQKEIAELERFD